TAWRMMGQPVATLGGAQPQASAGSSLFYMALAHVFGFLPTLAVEGLFLSMGVLGGLSKHKAPGGVAPFELGVGVGVMGFYFLLALVFAVLWALVDHGLLKLFGLAQGG